MRKYVFGVFILFIGVYFLLENLGYTVIGFGEIIHTYWPIIIIFIGGKMLIEGLIRFSTGLLKKQWRTGNLLFGSLITSFGIVLLGNKLAWFSVGIREFWDYTWPVLIIYFGISILVSNKWKVQNDQGHGPKIMMHKGQKKYKFDRRKHFIGETVYGNGQPWHLENVNVWHGIGEVRIDLTTAIIPDREVIIDITGIIGEVTVLVPQTLPLNVNVDVRIGDVTVLNHNQSGAGRFISYKSENYEQAQKKVNLMISLSIGEVTVKQVD